MTGQQFIEEHKARIIIACALVILSSFALVLYSSLGHRVIEAVYEGEALGLLNEIIEGQRSNSLQVYLDEADRLFARFMFFPYAVTLALLLSLTRARGRAILFFAAMTALIYLMSRGTVPRTSPDSTNYLSCAEHLTRGEGFYSTGFDQARHDRFIQTGVYEESAPPDGSRPYTHWGPLYPVVLGSLMFLTGVKPLAAALLVNRLSFSVILTFLYIVLLRMNTRRMDFAAPLTAVLVLFWGPFDLVFSHAWTELLYTALTLAAVFCLQEYYLSPPEREKRILAICAALTAMCLLTKYMGVSVLVTGVVIIAVKRGRAITRKKLTRIFMYGGVSSLPFALWLARNIYLTGYPGGGERGPAHAGLLENAARMARTAVEDVLIVSDARLAALAGVLIAAVCVLLLARKGGRSAIFGAPGRRHLAYTLYAAAYISFLLFFASTARFDEIGTRLLMPVYPFLIVVSASLISGEKWFLSPFVLLAA